MSNTGKVTNLDATETQKGVLSIASSPEAIAGLIDDKIITPKKLSDALSNALSGLKFSGTNYVNFDTFTQMVPNTFYNNTDPSINPPVEAKLPALGSASAGDWIWVLNGTGTSFKVTLNTNLILHYDGQIIEDIDGKFLLGDQKGSAVTLICGGSQQWLVYYDKKITLTSS